MVYQVSDEEKFIVTVFDITSDAGERKRIWEEKLESRYPGRNSGGDWGGVWTKDLDTVPKMARFVVESEGFVEKRNA